MLALNMIVGPFEEPFLSAAIASAMEVCDEFVFVDTSPGNNPNRAYLDAFQAEFPSITKIVDMARGEDKDFDFAGARELARVNSDSKWILRLDADEVLHEDTAARLYDPIQSEKFSAAVEVAFYHHMVYPWLYQYVEPKIIMFRKDFCHWYRGVHELLAVEGVVTRMHNIKFHHYGYCRGQAEVFKRWQLYVEIDGRPTWYHGQNPDHILDDRVAVCQNFTGRHPKAVQRVLDEMFKDVTPFRVKEIPRFSMSDNYAGLLLLSYNDMDILPYCLESLAETLDYPVVLHCLDQGSTDGSYEYLKRVVEELRVNNPYITSVLVEQAGELLPLSKAMNASFTHLMCRQECEYIGWIHPDMEFNQKWLADLVLHLNKNPQIGKLCAYNPRDIPYPVQRTFYPGQEQCYIVRRGVLLKTGLFDEAFIGIGGYEDWDLNRRIAQQGWSICIDPTVHVLHKGMQTRERRDTSYEQGHNASVYRAKWGDNKEVVI
jgi:GT2 family glycosyltransferase